MTQTTQGTVWITITISMRAAQPHAGAALRPDRQRNRRKPEAPLAQDHGIFLAYLAADTAKLKK